MMRKRKRVDGGGGGVGREGGREGGTDRQKAAHIPKIQGKLFI